MAVTKIWAVHDNISRSIDYCVNPEKTKLTDLERALLYAADKRKTLDEDEKAYAVSGINCNTETAAEEMDTVQKRFGKTGGIVAWHAYQSFKTGEVSPEEAHRIGVETARKLWGKDRQILVATHFNTGTYHNHFVINSVGMWDGKKLEAKYGVYYEFRRISDQICAEHRLTVIKDPKRHKTARSVYFAEKNGEPTRYNLMRAALDEAVTMSASWLELSTVLRQMGYVFECTPYSKYATIRSLHSKKRMRTFRLGEEYSKEGLMKTLTRNQWDLSVRERYDAFLKPYSRGYARYNPPTEQYYRKRDFYRQAITVTGYLSFFRCVAIVLGLEPLNGNHYQKPLSAECREACRKLDRYSEEIRLTFRERFETAEDIQGFIARTNADMDTVAAARQKVRNRQRNCKEPAGKEELKKKCADYTAALTLLRKEKKIACNILEDNPKLRELLRCEYEVRLENDPYLSGREKKAERNQFLQGAGENHRNKRKEQIR